MGPSVVMGWVRGSSPWELLCSAGPAALPESSSEAASEEEGGVNRLREHQSFSSFVKEVLEGGEPFSIEKTLCKITSSLSNRERL